MNDMCNVASIGISLSIILKFALEIQKKKTISWQIQFFAKSKIRIYVLRLVVRKQPEANPCSSKAIIITLTNLN